MASPLTVTRNDYHKNKKSSTIYTPVGVARFLFDILNPALRRRVEKTFTVLDPAIGTGRLTDPWFDTGCHIVGCDLRPDADRAHGIIKGKFEDCTWYDDWNTPDLVLCNPPFNGAPGKQFYLNS